MSHFTIVNIFFVVLSVSGDLQPTCADEPLTRFELRRAETKPGKDLVEAIVPKIGEKVYLHKVAEITAEDIATATTEDDRVGQLLKLTFTKEGRTKMEKLTTEHRDKPIALVLDGKVLVAPVIRSKISDQAVFSGIAKADLDRIVKGLKQK